MMESSTSSTSSDEESSLSSSVFTMTSDGRPSWLVLLCCASISFQLLRLSIDLIHTASAATKKDFKEEITTDKTTTTTKSKSNKQVTTSSNPASASSTTSSSYGSTKNESSEDITTKTTKTTTEGEGVTRPLLLASGGGDDDDDASSTATTTTTAADDVIILSMSQLRSASLWSFRLQLLLIVLLLGHVIIGNSNNNNNTTTTTATTTTTVLPPLIVWTAIIVLSIGAILTRRDVQRDRFGIIQRFLYWCSTITLYIASAMIYYEYRSTMTLGDELIMNAISLYGIISFIEGLFILLPSHRPKLMSSSSRSTNHNDNTMDASNNSNKKKKMGGGGRNMLSRKALLTLLKPYFWPDETSESAIMNRCRAIVTWVCVILSKVCNLTAPILLGWASTALAHEQYTKCIQYSIGYSMIGFFGSTLKEGQSLIYLKVAQAAFVQLSETTFAHLHTLSLDWHLRKKLGETIRSMDRGIAACDTLMKYLFLWLVPALVECFVVCIIFATYFSYFPLAITVFYFVWFYIVWTILVTLWRKKFRKAVVQSDNEWHDRCTDSLINFETVKFFTAEEYEGYMFGESVKRYQQGSVNVQASLSFLNVSQKLLLQICLAMALSMAAWGIKQRIDCCLDVGGCDSGVSECCQAIDSITCPGMQVGDFVAVLTYTLQLFTPLNFLGSIYNAVVMAFIDLGNLSELLAENPDVTDAPNAIPLPLRNNTSKTKATTTMLMFGSEHEDDDNSSNKSSSHGGDDDDDDVAVEFDNVYFHYPTQNSSKGLKGVSFKMKRGTTTAIVGPTGAGKTTISRLFFRFYDVLGGSIKVNGVDVRDVTQKSLRGAIGVVPQSASMFNDTIRTNLMYGRRTATQEELEQAARDAQLLDFILTLENGWDAMVGDRGLKLSGGEKQRAAIARCLLKDPPFVLLDEATSALDTLTENSVQDALDRLGSERTVLVIAHRLGTIRNADNILVLKDGLVAEQGTHDELLQKKGTYAEMWNMQLHSNSSRPGSSVNLAGMN